MKILWMSDSPCAPSGYGNATRFVCSGLARLGHEVSIIGWQTQGVAERWRGCALYPVGEHPFGADVLLAYLRLLRPDILITQGDLWRLSYVANPAIAEFMRGARIPWALYCAIDSDRGEGRLPPSFVRLLKAVALPVVVSRYGLQVARANGLEAAYIPYGVDTRAFRPPRDRLAAKRALGYENRFVVLCDARNQQRKLLPRCLEIFRRFAADKRDALLHLHCDPEDPAARTSSYCYNLRADIKLLGLSNKVRFTPGMRISRGVPLNELVALYRSADVHLLASYGEGFGLPTLQAAAAGVVPTASAYSASHELVAGHGEAIRVSDFIRDQIGMRCALISLDDAVGKLSKLYRDHQLRRAKSRASRRFAASYDWKQIVRQWHDLLEREVPRLRAKSVGKRVRRPISLLTGVASRRARLLPGEVLETIKKLESVGGHLTARILFDMVGSGCQFTLPATLPPAPGLTLQRRVPGRVYLASAADLPAFSRLKRVFPGLSAWSTAARAGAMSGWQGRTPLAAVGSEEYQSYLASSVLALDLGGVDPSLPALAARLRVPCIGPPGGREQARLWPGLSVESTRPARAAQLARQLLTDQCAAAEACDLAQTRGVVVKKRKRAPLISPHA